MIVEGIGTLRNRVVPGLAPAAGPARPRPVPPPAAGDVSGRTAGKVVVVTGAGQGQGAAEARLLAAEGATVLALDLGETPVEDLPGVEYRRLDVTDADGWKRLAVDLHGASGGSTGWLPTPGSPGAHDWPSSTRPTWPA